MLGKLLKYEIPAMGRKLLPLYAAWAVTAVFLGVSAATVSSKSEFVMVLSALLYTVVATAIVVMSVIVIVQRYSRSLLGDEAYFTQVLPVSTASHIANKLISAIIWIFITGLAAVLTGLIILLFAGLAGGFSGIDFAGPASVLHDLRARDVFSIILIAIELFVLLVASTVKTVMQIYTAITIGHQVSDHTTLASIGAYIAVLTAESGVVRLLMLTAPALMRDMEMAGIAELQLVFIPAFLITAAISAAYFFICKYLMEKKLNLA